MSFIILLLPAMSALTYKWIVSDPLKSFTFLITLDYRKHNSHHKEYSTGPYS